MPPALPEMMFILFVCYALSGYVLAALDFARRKSARRPSAGPPLP